VKEIQLQQLFHTWSGQYAETITLLPASGSNRKYYRITAGTVLAIGAYNPDNKENIAFTAFTNHFRKLNLPVPELYADNREENIYLIQDLGDTTLFSLLPTLKKNPQTLQDIYKKVIEALIGFQIKGACGFDFSLCYPRHAFDRQSMMWDLNYFKYYYLKPSGIPFDEQLLEEDFCKLCNYLLTIPGEFFLYRDFQSRNIMVQNDKLFFIDYQGGRKGALPYDLASLLYDAKADLSDGLRKELLAFYIEHLTKHLAISENKFEQRFYAFVLIRIMQAMGSYGFRGFFERKTLFLQSVPYAKRNLQQLLSDDKFPLFLPYLRQIIEKISSDVHIEKAGSKSLKVHINSFSYKKGIPADATGNGGGFVFDCRALPNPGRYDEYKALTGNDQPVINFLEKLPEVTDFLQNVFTIVDQSIDAYMHRRFENLMVNFGCTGGQHRSVYCAKQLEIHLLQKYAITVILHHE